MKKFNCILSIFSIGGIIISVIALLKFYDYTLCKLSENFFIAIFTGCIFAIPNGLLIVNEDIKLVRSEQTELLFILNTYFESIYIEDYSNYDSAHIENIRSNIVKSYKLLAKELSENYLRKKERKKIEELMNKIYDISSIILDLNKKYKKISRKNFNNDVKHICELRDSCIELIQIIQEKNYKNN
ncbi:MAG: hypothetical protein NC489_23390 [Ruminococcus flavefaciens]|nr:hypothetical protein [Ruminococcus flavefaciens]